MIGLRNYSWPAAVLTLAALLLLLAVPGLGQAAGRSGSKAPASPKPTTSAARAPQARAPKPQTRCVPQKPQPFLIRGKPGYAARALPYRIEQYGHPAGLEGGDGGGASSFLTSASFFGHPIRIHRRVVRPLQCVEAEIKRSCRRESYQAKAVGGFRDYNSYRGGEVSNHAFGIAIDIDPEQNPCCGCVDPWPNNPRCKGPARSIYDRMAMPACWVRAFERFGFYWLGHDQLQDTMHYEFLGDPNRYGP